MIVKLFKEYSCNKTIPLRNEIISHYYPLVEPIAKRVKNKYTLYNYELADLISFGSFGLIDAVEKYDISRGIKFESYSYFRISGAIIDGIREQDPLYRSFRQKINTIKKMIDLTSVNESESTKDDLIKDHFKKDTYDYSIAVNLIEYGSLETSSGDADYFKMSNTGYASNDVELTYYLEDCLNKLDTNDKVLIYLYYYENTSSKDISILFNRTSDAITKRRVKALRKLNCIIDKEAVRDIIFC